MRTALLAPALALAVVATGLAPGVSRAAEDGGSLLDRVIVDAAAVPVGRADPPTLLTVAAPGPGPEGTAIALALIRREDAWRTVAEQRIALAGSGLETHGTPWLIGLDARRFALVVPSLDAPRALVVGLRVGATADRLVETGRQAVDAPVDAGGAADVDGDGAPEVVLATARTTRRGATCQSSTLHILPPDVTAPGMTRRVADLRLAGGVVGRWESTPGDDLLAYGYPNCPAGPDDPREAVRAVVRLADGAIVRSDPVGGERLEDLPWLGPPLRLDLDGEGLHEAVAMTDAGLAALDPAADWRSVPLSSGLGFPVVRAPEPSAPASTLVAWLDLGGPDAVATASVGRDADGRLTVQAGHEPGPTRDPRSDPVVIEAIGSLARGGGVWGWQGGLAEPACQDILVPGAALPCGATDFIRGPIWIGARPILAYGPPGSRLALVAAGMAMDGANGYPASPTPWAVSPEGTWRQAPSMPFTLGEVDAAELVSGAGVRGPEVLVDPLATPNGTAVVRGPSGARLFVFVRPLVAGDPDPGPAPGWAAFVPRTGGGVAPTVLRLPGTDGRPSGAGESTAIVDLPGWGRPSAPERWALTVAAVDDRGAIARPVTLVVGRDMEPPPLDLEMPFLSPVWPARASLRGATEPGATVTIDGGGVVSREVDGRFSLPVELAPWPQTIRLVATDAAGNERRLAVSVVGGLDYRQLPWPVIVAALVLALALVSGLRGLRPRPASVTVAGSGEPLVEVEELPPGGR